MRLPFTPGVSWYVCQGYNGTPSHAGDPALDLTTSSSRGTTGCTPGDNGAANKPVVAPGAGQLHNLNDGFGGVCITFDAGGSMYFGHLTARRATGRVTSGTLIGKIAPSGQENNAGVAHLHLSARTGTGCGGTKVPFDSAHGARFAGAPNLTNSGTPNQWAGTKLRFGLAPCDFNGDGKTDRAVYRSSDRTWRVDYNGDGTSDFAKVYGATTNVDIPVPGDYNGDGNTDLAMWRKTDAVWRIDLNRDGTTDTSRTYGVVGLDVPAPGDYNGDGKTDLGVYRASDRTWRVDLNYDAKTNFQRVYGATTNIDIPVPADYNGDGRADLAMFRKTDYYWRIDTNLDGTTNVSKKYGGSTDIPNVGDFNGDGKADLSAWRKTDYYWRIDTNFDGTTNFSSKYGGSLDIPAC